MINRSPDRRFTPAPPDVVPAPSTRVKVRRDTKGRGRYDTDTIQQILDATPFCHLAYIVEDHPVVIPTLQVRIGDHLYLHASSGSRLGLHAGTPWPVSISVTLYDGLVLARSGFHHSINYRSVVVIGEATLVSDPEEKLAALNATVDHVVAGRSAEIRPPTARELEATAVARLPLAEASAKMRTGPPVDEPDDIERDIWAGVIPLRTAYGDPIPAPDLPEGIEVPDSVTRLVR